MARRGDAALMDPIDSIWPKIRAAFAQYGVTTRVKLGATRRNMLQRHLDDGIELEELPMAVHGYIREHKGLNTQFSNGLTSGDYLRFETVFKLDKMELRVELGAKGPWTAPRHSSRAAEREHKARAEREANRAAVEAISDEEREAYMDELKKKPRLRAV